MENKKTTIAILVVILLLIALIVISYFYNDFNTKQVTLLSEEANKIIESDFIEDNIDFEIKTEKNYSEVEKSIKEYIATLRNIYIEMQQMVSNINPNTIFLAQNIADKNLEEIDNIINEYKNKSQEFISEYEELITDEEIIEKIELSNISMRNNYYIDLYKEVMLSETMKSKYIELDEKIKNEKAVLYDKLNKIEKIKLFLEENDKYWVIENDKIQFKNINKMTEYYNLFNQIID